MPEKDFIKTSVLVIGGGMAGCFAAIKAREKGLDVILCQYWTVPLRRSFSHRKNSLI